MLRIGFPKNIFSSSQGLISDLEASSKNSREQIRIRSPITLSVNRGGLQKLARLSQMNRHRWRQVRAHSAAQCTHLKFGQCARIREAITVRLAWRNLTDLPMGPAAHQGGRLFDKNVHTTP